MLGHRAAAVVRALKTKKRQRRLGHVHEYEENDHEALTSRCSLRDSCVWGAHDFEGWIVGPRGPSRQLPGAESRSRPCWPGSAEIQARKMSPP